MNDYPPRQPCDGDADGKAVACAGAFVNSDTFVVERCDTCDRFEYDFEAHAYVREVLPLPMLRALFAVREPTEAAADRANAYLARCRK